MRLLPYSYFVYSNYILNISLFISAIIFYENSNTFTLLSIVSLGLLLINSLSKNKTFPNTQLIPTKFVIFSNFALAIILSFTQYLAGFSNNIYLSGITLIISVLTLFILIITNLQEQI